MNPAHVVIDCCVLEPCVCSPAANYTEELLGLHDSELLRVKEFHDKARPLLENVEKWEKNWALFQDFEVLGFIIILA